MRDKLEYILMSSFWVWPAMLLLILGSAIESTHIFADITGSALWGVVVSVASHSFFIYWLVYMMPKNFNAKDSEK